MSSKGVSIFLALMVLLVIPMAYVAFGMQEQGAPLPSMKGKRVAVFVSLCDNEHQGIAPVPAAIGDGDTPARNLYWGCSDALPPLVKRSKAWKKPLHLTQYAQKRRGVLELVQCENAAGSATIRAFAYRGKEQKHCVQDFEAALASGDYDCVIFVGHNPLMDFDLPLPSASSSSCAAAVFCCQSRAYFEPRLRRMGATPICLTQSNMYPGGFLVLALVETWLAKPQDLAAIRKAVAQAYANNQKISLKAALTVFADLQAAKSPTDAGLEN